MDHQAELNTARHYDSLYKKYGNDYKSLNWGSKNTQELRFKVLSEIDDLNQKSILDVGCGLGDYCKWLSNEFDGFKYTGIDITKSFINDASNNLPSSKFICASIFDDVLKDEKYDYVFASGVFATYKDSSFEMVESFISKLWALSIKGIAFNSLSVWAKDKDVNECYLNPLDIIELSKKLSAKVVFRHDYHPCDFTIYIYKD